MNIPGFNADATLYKTSGHYLTSRNMINLSTQMIYPSAEVINVEGCRPGFIQLGEGDNMVCIDPNDPFHRGGGSSGFSTGGGGGGGTGTQAHRPPPRSHPTRPRPQGQPYGVFTMADADSCSTQQLNTAFGSACVEQLEEDVLTNSTLQHEAICDPNTGEIWCCGVDSRTNHIISCKRGP